MRVRLIEEVDGRLYSLKDFIDTCHMGGFNDYDGYGYYTTETHVTCIVIKPSDVFSRNFNCKYPNIMWLNK